MHPRIRDASPFDIPALLTMLRAERTATDEAGEEDPEVPEDSGDVRTMDDMHDMHDVKPHVAAPIPLERRAA